MFTLFAALGLVGVVVAHFGAALTTPHGSAAQYQARLSAAPQTLARLLAITPDRLQTCDIALLNLLCAEGLRGSAGLNVTENLKLLDGLAAYVERETTRNLHRYRDSPEDFNGCDPIFRMGMLATVLQQDLHIHYNPDRIAPAGVFEPNDSFFVNSEDVFIHGLIGDKRMGTCASLPVLYVAVGRRIGYPLKLVPTKNHLFVRWEDENWRFNVDATGRGFHHYDDDHYRQWPFPVSREEEEEMGFLKSLSPSEELAEFLSLRRACLMSMGKLDEAVAAQEHAARLAPQRKEHQIILAEARKEREARLRPARVLLPDGRVVSAPRAEQELVTLRALQQSRQRLTAPWAMTGLSPTVQQTLSSAPNPLLHLRQGTP